MEQYYQALRTHHLRATAPRKTVFMALADASAPLAMADITVRCAPIDRVTLYRTLNSFVQAGIVRIVPVGWKRLYELTESFAPHHHHMVCTRCGVVTDIMSPELEKYIDQAAARAGFVEMSHTIEIRGVCSACE